MSREAHVLVTSLSEYRAIPILDDYGAIKGGAALKASAIKASLLAAVLAVV
jgi:hypothetical protein